MPGSPSSDPSQPRSLGEPRRSSPASDTIPPAMPAPWQDWDSVAPPTANVHRHCPSVRPPNHTSPRRSDNPRGPAPDESPRGNDREHSPTHHVRNALARPEPPAERWVTYWQTYRRNPLASGYAHCELKKASQIAGAANKVPAQTPRS